MKQRYYALDVFRGATVCLMILVNNPGSWSHIYGPLKHADWHGITPTDLVFPFFLFAVGNAMAFVMPRFQEKGDAYFWKKVIRRSLLIFAIGVFLQWWPFLRWQNDELVAYGWTWTTPTGKPAGIRILGVLQRIALCYFFASVIVYYGKVRGAFLIGMILLLLYWMLCFVLGNPQDPYSISGFFGNRIDEAVLTPAHMYQGEQYQVNGVSRPFEPEGLMSTIPAIVQVIFGFLVGNYIVQRSTYALRATADKSIGETHILTDKRIEATTGDIHSPLYKTLTILFVAAVGFLVAGYVWHLSFPVNKKLWTSSYVVATTGMAIALLSTMVYAIEIKGARNWLTRFFDVFGKNALFVFALSAFLPRGLRLIRIPNGTNNSGEPVYISPWNFIYERGYKLIDADPRIGSLLFALTVITFMWAICYWLDRKKIYIKV